jgi:quercetin dioxygenase-like cupin family protein
MDDSNAVLSGFPEGKPFDMTAQPRGPYRVSFESFHGADVPAEQRELRTKIYALEAVMKTPALEAAGLERIDLENVMVPVNRFSQGIYTRELSMPAGTVIVGKRHAQEHFCIVSKGKAIVTTEQGTQEISAPCQFISPAGSKRALVVLEDMVWTTVHRCDETDMEKVESALIVAEPDDALAALPSASDLEGVCS